MHTHIARGLLQSSSRRPRRARDLRRFERAPSRVRWLPNLWAGFTAAQTRTLRWSAYAAGALAGLLDHITEQAVYDAGWARGSMIALTVSLLLPVGDET